MQTIISGLSLKGVSAVLPDKELSMSEFYTCYGEKEIRRIVASTGIESVHVVNDGIKASDLCMQAADNLINSLHIDKKYIDAIIFVSQTADYRMPATSCILQHRLGLKKNVIAMDIAYGCSGYIYGLYQAAMLVKAGGCHCVLLCVGDAITPYLDQDDYRVRLLFGDAGSASLIENGDGKWGFDIQTDGSNYQELIIRKNDLKSDASLYMNGGAIMEFALREIKPMYERILKLQGWTQERISKVILHQANEFIVKYLQKKLELSPETVPIDVKYYGNTGPASIPLTLCSQFGGDLQSEGLSESILLGFGAGLSWGGVALDLSKCRMLSVRKYERNRTIK